MPSTCVLCRIFDATIKALKVLLAALCAFLALIDGVFLVAILTAGVAMVYFGSVTVRMGRFVFSRTLWPLIGSRLEAELEKLSVSERAS